MAAEWELERGSIDGLFFNLICSVRCRTSEPFVTRLISALLSSLSQLEILRGLQIRKVRECRIRNTDR